MTCLQRTVQQLGVQPVLAPVQENPVSHEQLLNPICCQGGPCNSLLKGALQAGQQVVLQQQQLHIDSRLVPLRHCSRSFWRPVGQLKLGWHQEEA